MNNYINFLPPVILGENMYSKKGISAIVAVVLMILISVAGVGILYGGVMPLFSSDLKASENSISIDTEGGYTLYDESQGIACVQVKRENSAEIEGLKVLFSVEGNSHSSIIDKADVPAVNEKKTYCFDLSDFGKPDTVTVVILPEGSGISITSIMPVRAIAINTLSSVQNNLRDIDGDLGDGGDEDIEFVSNGAFAINPDIGGNWIIDGYTWSSADWVWSSPKPYATFAPQWNRGTSFYQDVDTRAGTTYQVVFDVFSLVIMPPGVGGTGSFKATFDGTNIEITSDGTYSQDIVSDGSGRITFNFSNPTLGVDGAKIDNVSIKEV